MRAADRAGEAGAPETTALGGTGAGLSRDRRYGCRHAGERLVTGVNRQQANCRTAYEGRSQLLSQPFRNRILLV
ncbi:MAG: hypothetical protein HZY76_00315 [Anaerolineae bacterium]|nr:MAG: hypothetical protein HZY76_00315 [Anaerolineae bacterium]